MFHASLLNSWEPNRNEVNPVDYDIALVTGAGLLDLEIKFFCKDNPSKNKSSRNRNNFPIICWNFICSNENAI